METNILFFLLMGLACPIGMGVMMWLMNKNISRPLEQDSSGTQSKPISAARRLAELREQRKRIDAEIAELNELVELEALIAHPSSAPQNTPISAPG